MAGRAIFFLGWASAGVALLELAFTHLRPRQFTAVAHKSAELRWKAACREELGWEGSDANMGDYLENHLVLMLARFLLE